MSNKQDQAALPRDRAFCAAASSASDVSATIYGRATRQMPKECSPENFQKAQNGVQPPLTGFRLRCGDYRVFFDLKGETTIEVTGVRNRRDAYQ
jgi:mRNA-degrading endonuclease RelE of RelBE toxin-antitoxin system